MKFTESRTTVSEGRNGCYTCMGVIAYKQHGNIVLQGITSQWKEAKGDITIPLQDLPALIAELQALQDRVGIISLVTPAV